MSQTRTLPRRSEIDPALSWDLTHLFSDEAAAREELASLRIAMKDFIAKYPSDAIPTADQEELLNQTRERIDLMARVGDLSTYASLWYNEDLGLAASRTLLMDVQGFTNEVQASFSEYESQLADLPEEMLTGLIEKADGFEKMFMRILRNKPHRLSSETERVLAAFGRTFGLPYNAYQTAKAADLTFEPVDLEDRQEPLSYVLYENDYSVTAETELRRRSFEQFSSTIGQQRNTMAALYNAQIQREKVEATLRGFDSVIDFLLHRQEVSRDLYDRQIDGITKNFAPTMRRYAELLRRELGLERMTYADLKAPLDPELDPEVSIEEATEDIRQAFAIMGEDFQTRVMRFREEGWVDFAQNIGKSTGGFCASPVKAHPYILLSWTGKMSEAFTLAHELGHAAQTLYGREQNLSVQSSPSMYLVEAPSTMLELLLARYLLDKHKDDERLTRWVLDSMISKTYYHNFVTHLLEADFQREVYRLVDQGYNLGADDFDRLTRESLERFWGDGVEITEGAERTWMRQPHYYMGLYPYTYSAGLTLATGFYQRLTSGDETAVGDWIKFLQAGGSKTPLELAEIVGFDLSTSDLFDETLDWLDGIVSRIEALS